MYMYAGAPSHQTNAVIEYLKEKFSGRWTRYDKSILTVGQRDPRISMNFSAYGYFKIFVEPANCAEEPLIFIPW